MSDKLLKVILKAKRQVLWHLRNHENPCCCHRLMPAVLDVLSIRERRDGTIYRSPLPIHRLAFIIAYKRLEEEGEIVIKRSADVPFPATDFNSIFSLRRRICN